MSARQAQADAALDCLRQPRHVNAAAGLPPPFTSNLSVDETLVLGQAGYRPVSMVTGAAVEHLGLVRRRWRANAEVRHLTDAIYAARENSIRRLIEATEQAGGTGVAGVRLDADFAGRNLARFVAVGTAVTEDGHPGKPNTPFSSHLSGQELYLLAQAGFRPLGLVVGCSLYHVGRRRLGQALAAAPRNTELDSYTQALYHARELAMTRMQDEAIHLSASGVVGVEVTEASHVWGSRIIEFLAIGTAVAETNIPTADLRPRIVVAIDDLANLSSPTSITGRATGRGLGESLDAPEDRPSQSGRVRLTTPWRTGLLIAWLTAAAVLISTGPGNNPSYPAWAVVGQGLSSFGGILAMILAAVGQPFAPAMTMVAAAGGILASPTDFGARSHEGLEEVLVFVALFCVGIMSRGGLRRPGEEAGRLLKSSGPALRRPGLRMPPVNVAVVTIYLSLIAMITAAAAAAR